MRLNLLRYFDTEGSNNPVTNFDKRYLYPYLCIISYRNVKKGQDKTSKLLHK